MTAFSAINLPGLPAPEIIARLDFETIFTALKADLIARDPDFASALDIESDPATKLLQVWAYRELLLRAEFDDAGRGNMLAFAGGSNLDHLAAFYGVTRAVVQVADPSAIPPVPKILEDDDRLRGRTQLALEGFSTAGSLGGYQFWGLSASALIKDIGVRSVNAGEVEVTVLTDDGSGVADAGLLDIVADALSADDKRPLCDTVVVQSATIIEFSIEATIVLYDGPDSSLVVAAAQNALDEYLERTHRIAHDVTISGIHAALHQVGVQNVQLVSPAADLVIDETQAAFCVSTVLNVGGRDV